MPNARHRSSTSDYLAFLRVAHSILNPRTPVALPLCSLCHAHGIDQYAAQAVINLGIITEKGSNGRNRFYIWSANALHQPSQAMAERLRVETATIRKGRRERQADTPAQAVQGVASASNAPEWAVVLLAELRAAQATAQAALDLAKENANRIDQLENLIELRFADTTNRFAVQTATLIERIDALRESVGS